MDGFEEMQNANANGGTKGPANVATVGACKSYCVQNDSCTGFDRANAK